MNIHVDTLQYANDLQKAGIERAHAEAIAKLQAQTVSDLIEHELVTRDHLKSELTQLEARLKSELREEIRNEVAGLREEIRNEVAGLREEIRNEVAGLRDGIRNEVAGLRDEIRNEGAGQRDEIRNESTSLRRQMDTLMLQIRALQLGGAIATFSIAAIVLLTRLIR
jgi:gas vesicle protein